MAVVSLSCADHPPLVRWALLSLPVFLVTVLLADRQATAQPAVADVAEQGIESDAESADELGQEWVRVLRDDDGEPLALQTAIIRYARPAAADPDDVFVDLVGAVHVGDQAYYDSLNRRFTRYDALLYELVAPAGTVVERGRGTSNAHPVGALQNGMKQMLELEHQLEQIDYTRKNFVHADMSYDDMTRTMKKRGEGFLQMYFQLLGQSLAHQSRLAARGQSADISLLAAFFSADRARLLKTVMAEQLAEMESLLVGFGGENGSTLIDERNKVALEVLRRELGAGKKQLGVFYGAGHLADMDERMRHDFGMHPTQINWVTAWDLTHSDR